MVMVSALPPPSYRPVPQFSGIKDSFLGKSSFISVYDGAPRENFSQMLAQLTGEISNVSVIGHNRNTLTVVITSGSRGKCDNLDLTFDLVRHCGS